MRTSSRANPLTRRLWGKILTALRRKRPFASVGMKIWLLRGESGSYEEKREKWGSSCVRIGKCSETYGL